MTALLIAICCEGVASVVLLAIVAFELMKLNKYLAQLAIEPVVSPPPTPIPPQGNDWITGDVRFDDDVSAKRRAQQPRWEQGNT